MMPPLVIQAGVVRSDWLDGNGHMQVSAYAKVFDDATEMFEHQVGMTVAYRQCVRHSWFVAESHMLYHREMRLSDGFDISTQLLGFDAKRVHFFHRMVRQPDGVLVATNELLVINVDLDQRRAARMLAEVTRMLATLYQLHQGFSVPPQARRLMGLTAPPPRQS